jgi:cobalt/nickel transport system permease protein
LQLDRYIARTSRLHTADARLKFLLTVAFIVAISLLPTGAFVALAIAWSTIVVLSWSAHLGPFRTARSAFFALPFMLAALPLVFTRGAPYLATFDIGPLTLSISEDGMRTFATIALKSWVSVQAALLLAFTTPFHDLVDALRELRLPRVMVAIISFMYRYLGVIGEEVGRMNRARTARSADRGDGRAGGSLRWRAGVTGSMVGSLFLRSYERSERIYAAMQARGFDGELRYLPGPPIPRRALAVAAVALALLVVFEVAAHAWVPVS